MSELPTQEEIEQQVEALLKCQGAVLEWVTQRVCASFGYFEPQKEVPMWWRLFWLVSRNGGWDVTGWGVTSSAGLFGSGLEQNDALQLLQHAAFIDGLSCGSGENVYDQTIDAYEKFIEIHESAVTARVENG